MGKATQRIGAVTAASVLRIGGSIALASPATAGGLECGNVSDTKSHQYIDHKCTGTGTVTYTRDCFFNPINNEVTATHKFTGGTESVRMHLDCGFAKNTAKVTYSVS